MNSLILEAAPHWQRVPWNSRRCLGLEGRVASWIFESGSLTQRLRTTFAERVSVEVLQQGPHFVSRTEARALGVPPGLRLIIREVVLRVGPTPMILARSLWPQATMQRADRRLWRLGNQPLGEILFSHKALQRNTLEFTRTRLKPDGGLETAVVFGRRSLYTLGPRAPLLVAEFFLPPCLKTP